MKQLLVALIGVFFAGVVFAKDLTSTRAYACNDGSEMAAAYIATEAGGAYAVLLIDGRLHIAEVAVSASGARYITAEDGGYSWHVKRGLGLLTKTRAGVDVQEGTLSCREVSGEPPRQCAVTVQQTKHGLNYLIKDSTDGYEICDVRFPVKAGQQISAKWLRDSAHMMHILDEESQATFDTFPMTAEADREMHLRIGLPRAYARRATSPKPFSLRVTVK